MKIKLVVLIALLVSQIGKAQELPSAEQLYRSAVALYTDESIDYKETLEDSEDQIKAWRRKILQQRFVEKLATVEKVLSDSNTEVIRQIENYIKVNGLDSLDDTLLMRLAQLYYDRANFDFNVKMANYEKELASFQAGRLKKAPTVPVPNFKNTMFYSVELLKRFKTSPLSDWAHYLLGYCLFDEGQGERAAQIYNRMLTNTPLSPLAPEVRWRLAEYYFDMEKYDDALAQYRILSESKSPFARKAKYKLGATYFVLNRNKEAGELFYNLLKETTESLGSRDSEVVTVNDESVDYLAHLRARGIQYQLDEDTDSLVTERLALAYRRIQDEERSRKTYLEFVSRNSLSRYSPRFMTAVINSYAGEDKGEKAQDIRTKFINGLGPSSVFWQRHRLDVAATVEASDEYEVHILTSAAYYADKAKRYKKKADYDQAVSFYRKFLLEHAYSPLRIQARYDLAELQYFLGHYAEAAVSYLEVASDPASFEYRDEAAYGHLLSEVKKMNFPMQDQLLQVQRDKKGKLLEPTQPTEGEKKFLKVAQYYVNTVPSGVRRQKVLYRTAVIHFNHNQFEKSRQALEIILKDPVYSLVGRSAVQLVANTYDVENNWEKFSEANRRAVRLSGQMDPDDLLELEGLENGLRADVGILQEAYSLDILKKPSDAAQLYERLSVDLAKSPDAPRLLFRAAVNYRRVQDYASSQRLFEKLIRDHSDSKFSIYAEYFKAANDSSLLQFEKAAGQFDVFAKTYSKHALSTHAILSSAVIRKNLGQTEMAAVGFSQYGKRTQDEESWFLAASLYSKIGKLEAASDIYERYTNGKLGRQYVIRALFERALLGQPLTASKSRVKQSLADCAAIDVIAKKYSLGLTASNQNGIQGCRYMATVPLRNTLIQYTEKPLSEKLDKEKAAINVIWTKLEKIYSSLEPDAGPYWVAQSHLDKGVVFKGLAKKFKTANADLSNEFLKRAGDYYQKAVDEASKSIQGVEIKKLARLGLQEINPSNVNLLEPAALISLNEPDPSLIRARISGDAVYRGAFEQGSWARVVQITKPAAEKYKDGNLYMVWARALAESGSWQDADQVLNRCFQRLSDSRCAAALLVTGRRANADNLKGAVDRALTGTDTDGYFNLALAYFELNRGKFREALSQASAVVTASSMRGEGYLLAARILGEMERWDLAELALSEARASELAGDTTEVFRGYLALKQNYFDEAAAIASEFQSSEVSSPSVAVYIANFLFYSGKVQESLEFLTKSKFTGVNQYQIRTAQFGLGLLTSDLSVLEKMASDLAKWSLESSKASLYLALYFKDFKGDGTQAMSYFKRAKDQGLFGFRWDSAFRDMSVRKPAKTEPVKEELPKEESPKEEKPQ